MARVHTLTSPRERIRSERLAARPVPRSSAMSTSTPRSSASLTSGSIPTTRQSGTFPLMLTKSARSLTSVSLDYHALSRRRPDAIGRPLGSDLLGTDDCETVIVLRQKPSIPESAKPSSVDSDPHGLLSRFPPIQGGFFLVRRMKDDRAINFADG